MRIAKSLLLTGAAALTVAVGAGLALADPLHTLIVRLPGGGFVRIEYSGRVPPRVALAPPGTVYAASDPTFATLDRISAQMDREMDALVHRLAMEPGSGRLFAEPNAMLDVAADDLPSGTMHYSAVSTTAGGGNVCSRSVEITRSAPGAPPHVVEHMSGNCRGVGNMQFGVAPPPPAPQHRAASPIQTRDWRPRAPFAAPLLNVAYKSSR